MTRKTEPERIVDYANTLKDEITIAEKKYKETGDKIHQHYADAIGNILDCIIDENDLVECEECHRLLNKDETITHAVEDGYVELCKDCYEKTEEEDSEDGI